MYEKNKKMKMKKAAASAKKGTRMPKSGTSGKMAMPKAKAGKSGKMATPMLRTAAGKKGKSSRKKNIYGGDVTPGRGSKIPTTIAKRAMAQNKKHGSKSGY